MTSWGVHTCRPDLASATQRSAPAARGMLGSNDCSCLPHQKEWGSSDAVQRNEQCLSTTTITERIASDIQVGQTTGPVRALGPFRRIFSAHMQTVMRYIVREFRAWRGLLLYSQAGTPRQLPVCFCSRGSNGCNTSHTDRGQPVSPCLLPLRGS